MALALLKLSLANNKVKELQPAIASKRWQAFDVGGDMSFQNIIGTALNTVAKVAGETITYTRGANWTTLQATPGLTNFQLVDTSGVVSEFRSRDYIVPTCKLSLNGARITPQRGDTITVQAGPLTNVYEVSRPDGGEQPYGFSGIGHTHFRIHTKLKSTT